MVTVVDNADDGMSVRQLGMLLIVIKLRTKAKPNLIENCLDI